MYLRLPKPLLKYPRPKPNLKALRVIKLVWVLIIKVKLFSKALKG